MDPTNIACSQQYSSTITEITEVHYYDHIDTRKVILYCYKHVWQNVNYGHRHTF